MIGRLRGTLAEKQPPHLLLDVGGVGYEVEVPMTTLYRLPAQGEVVTLHTHLVVREDAHLLYGFGEKRERELFRELIRLNGVGPKLALALMSSLEVDELVRCVQAQDTAALVKVPGVGKKTAERLLLELMDRFTACRTLPAIPPGPAESGRRRGQRRGRRGQRPGRPGLQAPGSQPRRRCRGRGRPFQRGTHPSRPEGHGLIP